MARLLENENNIGLTTENDDLIELDYILYNSKKFLNAAGIAHLMQYIDENYPDNVTLGAVVNAIQSALDTISGLQEYDFISPPTCDEWTANTYYNKNTIVKVTPDQWINTVWRTKNISEVQLPEEGTIDINADPEKNFFSYNNETYRSLYINSNSIQAKVNIPNGWGWRSPFTNKEITLLTEPVNNKDALSIYAEKLTDTSPIVYVRTSNYGKEEELTETNWRRVSYFPTEGQTNIIYIERQTTSIYYWNGEKYQKLVYSNPIFENSITIGSRAQSQIGQYSAAIGNDCVATNYGSIAIGYQAVSTGYGGVAIGWKPTASSYCGIAIGDQAVASSNSYCYALGGQCVSTGGSSIALGYGCSATSYCAQAFGYNAKATGYASHAEGYDVTATGSYSHVEGYGYGDSTISHHGITTKTGALASYSHVEGQASAATSNGYTSHVEGYNCIANADYVHVEGSYCTVNGYASHAEGYQTYVSGQYSHAEGYGSSGSYTYYKYSSYDPSKAGNNRTTSTQGIQIAYTGALSYCSHVEGYYNTANGSSYNHIEGAYNITNGTYAGHIEGYYNYTENGSQVHIEGSYNFASGTNDSHIEGKYNAITATGNGNHAEGGYNYLPSGYYSHIEGEGNFLTGSTSNHVEGFYTYLSANRGNHAEGYQTMLSASDGTHVEGIGNRNNSISIPTYSSINVNISNFKRDVQNGSLSFVPGAYGGGACHAEGYQTYSSGASAMHSEGYQTYAGGGTANHAEGYQTQTAGSTAIHAEGYQTYAQGAYGNHAEGYRTMSVGASGIHSEGYCTFAGGNIGNHAEGCYTYVSSYGGSHAEGYGTYTVGYGTHVGGCYNLLDDYVLWPEWTPNTAYKINDKVKRTTQTETNLTINGYICNTANQDETFTSSKWTQHNVTVDSSTILTGPGICLEIIGNGTEIQRSNARVLDRDGNEYLAGNLYINYNFNNRTGKKVATEEYVDTTIAASSQTFTADRLSIGYGNQVDAANSVAIGNYCRISSDGQGSLVVGSTCYASYYASQAMGYYCSTQERYQHVFGKFLAGGTGYVELVGNGTGGTVATGASRARALDWNGNEYLNGDLYVRCNATSQNGKKVATEEYVATAIANAGPVDKITIGNTTITESQLQQLLALLNNNTNSEAQITDENGTQITDENGNPIEFDLPASITPSTVVMEDGQPLYTESGNTLEYNQQGG